MNKTPAQMALEYIKDVETARNPSITATAFPQMQRCFLAGYQAAKDEYKTKISELEIELENWKHTAIHGDEGL